MTFIDQLSIAVCTRDRWRELQRTLENLRDQGLEVCPLLLGDDASADHCPLDLSWWVGGVHVLRSEQHLGLIAQRNRLIEFSRRPYILVLDDDSNPTAADFSEGLRHLKEDKVAVVGFPIRFPNGQWQVAPSQSGQRHRSFTGCANIVKKDLFMQVGGYTAELVHQGEEMDLGVRLYAADLACVHCQDPVFEHRFVQVSRYYERMDYYGTRNELLFNDWYAPRAIAPFRIMRALVKRFLHFLKVRRLSVLNGIIGWIKVRGSLKGMRKRLTYAQWRGYMALPY